MENLKVWWDGLASREQQLLGIGAILMLLALVYWGVWTPVSDAQQAATDRLEAQRQTLTYVKDTANRLVGLRQRGSRPSQQGSITNIVNQAAGRHGLVITRMQPQGNKIQLWMDEVPFDTLLVYLDELVEQQGLSLELLDVAEGEETGMVKVRRIQLAG